MGLAKKASEVAALLDLKPNPEGGFYSETFRDDSIVLSTSQLPPQYCGKNDPELSKEMEKQFVDLLTEELELQKFVAEEYSQHMNTTLSMSKDWLLSNKERLRSAMLQQSLT